MIRTPPLEAILLAAAGAASLGLAAADLHARPPLKSEPEPANVAGLLVGYGCKGYAGRIYRAEEDQFPAGGCRDIHRASILDDDQ